MDSFGPLAEGVTAIHIVNRNNGKIGNQGVRGRNETNGAGAGIGNGETVVHKIHKTASMASQGNQSKQAST